MKRQLLAVAIGGLFALPAFANNEIDAGNLPPNVTPSKTRAQVRAELVAAQRSGDWIVNAELGNTARSTSTGGKTRETVLTELTLALASGDYIVNAELGTKANQL